MIGVRTVLLLGNSFVAVEERAVGRRNDHTCSMQHTRTPAATTTTTHSRRPRRTDTIIIPARFSTLFFSAKKSELLTVPLELVLRVLS